ncbi:hypothetical protein INT45_000896 [Circinella minor]|uniref:Chromo domain-containing protein n=1 Tax=Circinella minor TaxID=1195481 RepID=A0A8H7RJ51_9FUNG|nr:hypothetical protein INT45_000896 [Circinella minor]
MASMDFMADEYIYENSEQYGKYKTDLKKEIDNIVLNKWGFLDKDWDNDTNNMILDIEENENEINNESEDDFPELKENIIEHKIIDKSYKSLVRWKGFNSNDNSWISLSSFNEKELLVDYLSDKNILIPGINL